VNRSSINYRSGLLVVGLTVAIALALIEYKPKAPLSGRVTLEYSGTREEQSRFGLTNGSARPVWVSGWSSILRDTLPDDYYLTCETGGTVTTAIGPPFDFPPPRAAESIQVSSGEALQLAMPNIGFGKGSRCYLELTMDRGPSLKSNEFGP
jgi:hypothetical protein